MNVSRKRSVEVVQRAQAQVGEGPVWVCSEQTLYWVDIKGQEIFALHAATGRVRQYRSPERIGALIPRTTGGFIALLKSGVFCVDDLFCQFKPLIRPEPDRPGNRFNDATCDPLGRLWAGTMDDAETDVCGSLYRIDADLTVYNVRQNLHLPNGVGFSPDARTFYLTDSLQRVIYAYDYDLETGVLRGERIFARVADGLGYPDGLAIDDAGCVWSVHWGGWRITKYAADGRVLEIVPVPVPQPSSCAFGGAGLSDLFVTSAAFGLSPNDALRAPLSGSVFVVSAGAVGCPIAAFSG